MGSKFIDALHIGFEILFRIEQILAGQADSVEFGWKGRRFTISIAPKQ